MVRVAPISISNNDQFHFGVRLVCFNYIPQFLENNTLILVNPFINVTDTVRAAAMTRQTISLRVQSQRSCVENGDNKGDGEEPSNTSY